MTQLDDPILDYRPARRDPGRPPRWLLKLIVVLALITFPFAYALFAVTLIVAPFLLLAGLGGALIGITACTLTGVATFGSLWAIDRCLDLTDSA